MKIKAVLFDMDGVLIEAKDWHFEALNRALELFGMPISRFDHITTFDGLSTRQKLEMLSLERGLPRGLHEFLNGMKQLYTMEMVYTQCKPLFAHEYALSSLKAAGYNMAVCSNSIRNTVETMMQKSGLDRYLDLMVSNEDVKKGKPEPDIYLKAINHFGLNPSECLILEDNENGIKAAKASGAHLLIVEQIADTNLNNIQARIRDIESAN
jgi:beta-phosphoglucomutase